MVSMVRDGAISPVELVERHLQQIEARNPALNAFVTVMADRAREEARERERAIRAGEPLGLLHGVPLTVKDSFDIAGQPTRIGSRLRTEQPAANDAAAVARLRSHGAIILGRTNTPELLAAYETDNFITGRTNNPWDLERTPGGSSGGEAAAIAAFCSPGGLASDGGGSLRIPAHFCGIAGLKPTPGRISGTGHTPSLGYPAGLLTAVGPMARTAQDLHLLFSALAGYDAQDPLSVPVPLRQPTLENLRIGVWEQFYSVPVDPEIRAAIVHAAALLADLGWAVEPFEPRGLERAPNVWAVLFGWPAAATRKLMEGRAHEAHWTLLESLAGTGPSADQVLLNLAARDRMRAALLRQMENTAALLMPVSGITAFRHRERKWQIEDQTVGLFQAMMPAVLANVLGFPAVTVPMAISAAGLPIGVQLVGKPYEDELLLDIAVRLEQARGAFPVGARHASPVLR
jgi:Asp-tRNA(Asn)/Glu-tRNA(Gln) amidotransferase A subunit family amidase